MCFWLSALTPCRTCSSSSFWPSRAGCGPARLRFAPRSRAAASTARGPLLAAPPLGPRGPGSDPPLPLLDHRGAGRLRASSLRSSGPAGPPGSPGSLPLDLRARVPVGPPLRPPTLGGVHFMGGRALPPGHYPTPVGGRDSLPAGGVLSQAYASVYVRARRSGRRYDRRRLAGSPQGGGARPFVAASPPRWGGRGGTWPEPWEAPCRPGADGRRRRTGSCALAVPDALAVRHSNPNCYRPRWVKQVSSDKASPPTNCVILVSRNRGSPDRFESDWMHELRAVSGILRTQCGRRGSGTRETTCNLPAAQPARPRGSTLAPVAQPSPRGSTVAPAPRPPPRGPTLLPLAPQHSSPPCGSILSHLAGVGG